MEQEYPYEDGVEKKYEDGIKEKEELPDFQKDFVEYYKCALRLPKLKKDL